MIFMIKFVTEDIESINNRNINRMNKNKNKNNKGKELRKPISTNFAPKRLAINFEPPMIIMEYLVVDTGKLYHHKMRLDSVLRKPKVNRDDVLNYIKTKHHLYFVSGKVKDAQLFKFIDKLLLRKGIITKVEPVTNNYVQQSQPQKQDIVSNNGQDDFDYLNDEEQEQEYYEEDYEDYEDASNFVNEKKETAPKQNGKLPEKKNAFLAYCQEYEEGDGDEAEGHAQWDLDMDQNDDFV